MLSTGFNDRKYKPVSSDVRCPKEMKHRAECDRARAEERRTDERKVCDIRHGGSRQRPLVELCSLVQVSSNAACFSFTPHSRTDIRGDVAQDLLEPLNRRIGNAPRVEAHHNVEALQRARGWNVRNPWTPANESAMRRGSVMTRSVRAMMIGATR